MPESPLLQLRCLTVHALHAPSLSWPLFCVTCMTQATLLHSPTIVAVLGTSHAKIALCSRSFKDTRGLGIANSKRRCYIPPEPYIDTNEYKNVINVKCNVNSPSNKSQRMKCTQPSTTCKRTPPQVTQIAQRSYHHSPPQESGRPRAPQKEKRRKYPTGTGSGAGNTNKGYAVHHMARMQT